MARSAHNSNNCTGPFLCNNHHASGCSKSALFVLPIVSHRILEKDVYLMIEPY